MRGTFAEKIETEQNHGGDSDLFQQLHGLIGETALAECEGQISVFIHLFSHATLHDFALFLFFRQKFHGSVELGPIVRLADVIVDIVETGSTLKENGLKVLEEICPLSARMIVNQVSMQMEPERIKKLITDIRRQLS